MAGEQFVINVVMTGVPQAERGAARVTAATQGMDAAAKGAAARGAASATTLSQKWTNAGTRMADTGKRMNRGLTLPILALGAVTGKLAIDFEKSMRNVNSIAQLPEKQFQALNSKVLEMAGRVAQAPKTLAEGLYDLVSSGFDAAESITILESSAKAATAGLTTTEVSTKAVAAALNAYHRPAKDAQMISDDLFQTVNLGVVTFDELASTIGYVLPAAATMGVDLKQVGASISTLTKQGQSGSNAVTNINAALTAFIKPSKDMKGLLKELGYETSLQLVNQKGFQGALELVTRAVHGNKEAIGELFPNVRAMRAVFGLTGEGAKSAQEDLRGFANDAGATAKVLAEQRKSISFQWNQLKAEGAALGIELGNKLIPILRDLAGDLMGIVKAFGSLPEGVQTGTLKLLAFGAAMGPVLYVGGNFVRMLGGIAKGMQLIAGTSLIGNLTAALSMKGERGAALKMVGGDMGKGIMGGLTKTIGPLAAAAGLGNIVYSASKGDWESAGFKGGGALIGGIAGAFLGKSPQAAMLGAGIGSFLGGLVGNLFGGGDEQSAFKKRNEDTIASALRGHQTLIRSSRQVAHTEQRLHKIGDRQADINRRLRATQERLNQARKAGDTGRVRHEEARLNELKAKQINLTHRQWREESLLHTANVKNIADSRRARTVEVALVRTRQAQLEQSQKHERTSRKAFEQAVLQNKPLKEQNERERELIDAQRRRKGASEKLRAAEKELGGTMKEISDRFGEKFADKLRKQIPLWGQTAKQIRMGREAMQQLAPSIKPLSEIIQTFGERGKTATKKVQKGAEQLRQKAPPDLRRVGAGYRDLSTTGTEALGQLGTNTNSFLQSLHADPLNFSLQSGQRERKARGGLMRIKGSGKQDTVPLNVMGTPVVAAPGEDIAFVTQHQRRDLDHAVANTYGDRSLGHFFNRQDRPHYMAKGGLVEPRLTGPDPMQDAGQMAIHKVTQAAQAYIRKIGGDKTYVGVRKEADRMDRLQQPYLWGGGHGASPSREGPWDCSGAVSQLLYGAGWKDLSPMVSGGFESWGSPGRGRVSVMANPEHVYSVIGGRAWGTSGENPGGGAGWIDSYSYRSGFTERHAELMGEGEPAHRRTGRGQSQKKGFSQGGYLPVYRYEKGGWVQTGYTTYSGSGGGASGDLQRGNGYAELGTASAETGAGTGVGFLAPKLGRSGELPFGYALEVDVGRGKVGTLFKYDRGAGQGSSAYGLDIHTGGFAAVGLTGHSKGQAKIRAADGSGGKVEEEVPAIFHGVRTKRLDFPGLPKTLQGINKEIGKRVAELERYRRAAKAADGKPKIQQALTANVVALEGRLKELRRGRALERRKAAQKRVTRKLSRKLGKLTGIEEDIERGERAYEIASQYAEQLVALEPLSPELPENASEKQREDAEKAYVEAFRNYVEGQERPAYSTVLDTLADWRDTTLHGEDRANQFGIGWEKDVRHIGNEIDGINNFTEKVGERKEEWRRKHPKDPFPDWLQKQIKEVHEQRSRLPTLRFRDRETRNFLGQARERFWPGRKNPIEPPNAPIAGTGSFEDTLIGIQGIHWPDQHSPMKPLPGKRVAGMFGGSIWDTQGAIEELGLRIGQAAAGAGGGGGGDDNSEKLALEEEANRQLRRELAVSKAQAPVLADYLGAYETGGILPDTGFYLGHKGERVIPANEVGGEGGVTVLEPHIHLSGAAAALDGVVDARVELRLQKAGSSVGLSRSTPSAAGRRAILSGPRRKR